MRVTGGLLTKCTRVWGGQSYILRRVSVRQIDALLTFNQFDLTVSHPSFLGSRHAGQFSRRCSTHSEGPHDCKGIVQRQHSREPRGVGKEEDTFSTIVTTPNIHDSPHLPRPPSHSKYSSVITFR